MHRVKAFFTAALCCTSLQAATPELTEIDSPVAMLDYHVRLEPARNSYVPCTMVWNYTDPDNFTALVYSMAPATASDPQLGFEAEYSVVVRRQGTDSLVSRGYYHASYPGGKRSGLSAVLKVNGDKAAVHLGGSKAEYSIPVPFDHLKPGAIGYTGERQLKELRHTLRLTRLARRQRYDCENADSLCARLAKSSDPAEGLWTYLDRKTDPAKARPGGNYKLATVAEADGSYTIVYLGEAEAGASHWAPLDIKGRLLPTPFEGHFNLEWTDSDLHRLDKETSATLELDGAILRLDFPLIDASLRFARQKP